MIAERAANAVVEAAGLAPTGDNRLKPEHCGPGTLIGSFGESELPWGARPQCHLTHLHHYLPQGHSCSNCGWEKSS